MGEGGGFPGGEGELEDAVVPQADVDSCFLFQDGSQFVVQVAPPHRQAEERVFGGNLSEGRQHTPGGGGGDAGLRTAIEDPHADLLLGELPGTSRADQSASDDYDIGLGHGTALL